LVDQAASAQGEVVDKMAWLAREGVAQAERVGRDLGKTLSPKRLMKRAIVAATLAMVRRHLGVVGAAAGTLVLAGAGGYYAGHRSH